MATAGSSARTRRPPRPRCASMASSSVTASAGLGAGSWGLGQAPPGGTPRGKQKAMPGAFAPDIQPELRASADRALALRAELDVAVGMQRVGGQFAGHGDAIVDEVRWQAEAGH